MGQQPLHAGHPLGATVHRADCTVPQRDQRRRWLSGARRRREILPLLRVPASERAFAGLRFATEFKGLVCVGAGPRPVGGRGLALVVEARVACACQLRAPCPTIYESRAIRRVELDTSTRTGDKHTKPLVVEANGLVEHHLLGASPVSRSNRQDPESGWKGLIAIFYALSRNLLLF